MSWMMLPVAAGLARALDGLVDLDHPTLELRDGAFIFFLERTRQHDVGVACALAHEEVDGDVVLELLERLPDEVVVRQRDDRVEADAQQSLDLAAVDLADDLVGIDARLGERGRIHPPHAGDVGAVLGIGEVAPAGELVAFLAVLASALAVGLSRDRRVAAVRAADAPGGQHDVDGAHHVLDAVAVVLEPPRMAEKARLRRAPPLGGLLDRFHRDAGDLRRSPWRPFAHVRRDGVEPDRVVLDKRDDRASRARSSGAGCR